MTVTPRPLSIGGDRSLDQWEALSRKHAGEAVDPADLAACDRVPAVAFYDVAVHGTRVRVYEHAELGTIVGRRNVKRLGLILTKKQRARARRNTAIPAATAGDV